MSLIHYILGDKKSKRSSFLLIQHSYTFLFSQKLGYTFAAVDWLKMYTHFFNEHVLFGVLEYLDVSLGIHCNAVTGIIDVQFRTFCPPFGTYYLLF